MYIPLQMMTSQTSPASLHLRLWYRNYIAKAIDALQVTQRTLDIVGDNAAEAQEGTNHRDFYCLPNYWIPEEQQFSISLWYRPSYPVG